MFNTFVKILPRRKETRFLLILFIVILLDCGGAYRRSTYFIALLSLLALYFHANGKKVLIIEKGKCLFLKGLILLSGFVSTLIGLDTGECIYGMIKLIVTFVVFFWLLQIDSCEKEVCIKSIPIIGIMMMFLSGLTKRIPYFDNWISNTGRLAGAFEYPNTMALFLLMGIVIAENLLQKKRIVQITLCVGLLMTGSRTAFLLFCGYLLSYCVKSRNRNKYLIFYFVGFWVFIATFVLSGKKWIEMPRFLILDFYASTFQGRLLYWEDACRMLFKNPFGIGYMGYFYLQQVMQTGVYSVRFVHNEWLQCMLDYGILAGIGAFAYFLIQFRYCKAIWKKELLCLIVIYSFFDFHLQYWSILIILLMLIEPKETALADWQKRRKNLFTYLFFIMFSITILFETAEFWSRRGEYQKAVCWNPFSTDYRMGLLLNAPDLEKAEIYADQALNNNQYLYAAYKIKASVAAERRNTDSFIENEKQVLKLRKYDREEYEEYFRILYTFFIEAKENNDYVLSEQCIAAMEEIPEIMIRVKKETSVRAFRIREKPELYLNPEYEKIIKILREEN